MSSKNKKLIQEQNKGIIMISCVTAMLIAVIGVSVLLYDRNENIQPSISENGIVQDKDVFHKNTK